MTTTVPERATDRRRDSRAAAFCRLFPRAARRRLHRLRSSRWPTRCARSARTVRVVNSDPAPPPMQAFPGVPDIEIADRVDGEFDAAIVMECGDLSRTGVAGLDRFFVINIDHHPGNKGYGDISWFDESAAACGEMVFDVDPRPRRAADGRDRHAYLSGHPDRHRFVPLFGHLAADLRHLPADARSRRRSGGRRAQRVRQQQHGPAEAVWMPC